MPFATVGGIKRAFILLGILQWQTKISDLVGICMTRHDNDVR